MIFFNRSTIFKRGSKVGKFSIEFTPAHSKFFVRIRMSKTECKVFIYLHSTYRYRQRYLFWIERRNTYFETRLQTPFPPWSPLSRSLYYRKSRLHINYALSCGLKGSSCTQASTWIDQITCVHVNSYFCYQPHQVNWNNFDFRRYNKAGWPPAEILFISMQFSRLRVRDLNSHVGLIRLKEIPLKFSVKIKHSVLHNEWCTFMRWSACRSRLDSNSRHRSCTWSF